VAGAARRGAIGAVLGAAFGALNGSTTTERILQAAFDASLGFWIGATFRMPPTLPGLSRRERTAARRCARRGVAPDDARLAPGALSVATFLLEPLPFARAFFWLFAAWTAGLTLVTALCVSADDVWGAVSAGIGAVFAALMCLGISYVQRVIQPRATKSYAATMALMQQPAP
jgi:hypothetical protein